MRKTANVKIAIGLALYKSGEYDEFAKSGKNEWVENSDIIKRQILLIEADENINGYSFYSSKYLLNDYNDNLKSEKMNLIG